MTVRKRKIILKKLNAYFSGLGKILTEVEYRNIGNTPVRLVLIKKFFISYDKMTSSIRRYYPEWRRKAEIKERTAAMAAELAQAAALQAQESENE